MYPEVYHIGTLKTGTTSIQAVLDKDPRINLILQSRFFNTNRWFKEKYPNCSDLYVNVESDENIARGLGHMEDLETSLQRIQKVNPEAQILYTIREQRSAIISMYKHHIRQTESTASLTGFVNSEAGKTFIDTLDYYETYKTIARFFPTENIHFFRFERLKNEPRKFYQLLYTEVLDLPFKNGIQNIAKNRGWNHSEIRLKKNMNKFRIWDPTQTLGKIERRLHLFLIKIFAPFFISQKPVVWEELEKSARQDLESRFTSSNQQFEKKIQINLSTFGYLN